jgi:uncharacterized protein (TIGR00251 family)
MLPVKETGDGITFAIRVLPRSSRCEIAGVQDNALKLKITAPPVEGAANEECIKFLSKRLDVAKSRISIVTGGHSRLKTVHVAGLTRKDFDSRIPEAAG